ncbi:hypothetical protein MRX96_005572 [Rhipicephalus microplus]
MPSSIKSWQSCSVMGRNVLTLNMLNRNIIDTRGSGKRRDGLHSSTRHRHTIGHSTYIFATLLAFGFPRQFVYLFMELYNDIHSDLTINNETVASFPVERHPSVLGLQTPGSGSLKVAAYADDITIYHRYEDSLAAVLQLFTIYAEHAGAKLNLHKCKSLCLHVSPVMCLHGIFVVDNVTILGIDYRATGVTNQIWEEEVKTRKQEITRALEFDFPYYVRRYLLMGVFIGRLWFLTNSVVMSYQIARKVRSQIIRFFWNARTALVKYEQLELPCEKGGWNIPSVVGLADTYVLKTTLKVLQLQEEHPARKLATYFLGVQSRFFLQTQPAGPKAMNPTPFYRHVVGIYKSITALNLDTPHPGGAQQGAHSRAACKLGLRGQKPRFSVGVGDTQLAAGQHPGCGVALRVVRLAHGGLNVLVALRSVRAVRALRHARGQRTRSVNLSSGQDLLVPRGQGVPPVGCRKICQKEKMSKRRASTSSSDRWYVRVVGKQASGSASSKGP